MVNKGETWAKLGFYEVEIFRVAAWGCPQKRLGQQWRRRALGPKGCAATVNN